MRDGYFFFLTYCWGRPSTSMGANPSIDSLWTHTQVIGNIFYRIPLIVDTLEQLILITPRSIPELSAIEGPSHVAEWVHHLLTSPVKLIMFG